MEMHQIRYFLAVADTLNFTRAAEQCGVAQPSLTRAVKKLEEELGGDLFHREGRRTHLTSLGQMMRPLLAQSLEAATAAKEQASSYGKHQIAHLRIGLSLTIEIRMFRDALSEIARVLPGVNLQLSRGTAEDIEQELEDGQIDIAITAKSDPGWDRMRQWPLWSEGFDVAFAPGSNVSCESVMCLADLEGKSLISRRHCEGREAFSGLVEQSGIELDFADEVCNEHDLEFVLENKGGAGLVPRSICLGNNDIIRFPLDPSIFQRTLFLYAVAGRRHSGPVDLFLKLMRAKDWQSVDLEK